MSNEPVTLHIEMRAREGKAKDLQQALLDLRAESRREEGCTSYELSRQLDDPNVVLLYELWETESALDAHNRTPHLAAFRARLDELLIEPPRRREGTPLVDERAAR